MSDPFRDSNEALHRRVEALETERDELRRQLAQRDASVAPKKASSAALALSLVAILMLLVGAASVVALKTRSTARVSVAAPSALHPADLPLPTPVPEDLGLSLLKNEATNDLFGVWSDARDTIVVGDRGALAHGGGLTAMGGKQLFRDVDAGTSAALQAITRRSPLYAVGDHGTIVEVSTYGVAQPVKSPTQKDLLGVVHAGAYVYAVGRGGTIVRYVSEWGEWRLMDSPTKQDLRAIGTTDGATLVAVGTRGTIIVLGDGIGNASRQWRVEASGTEEDLDAIAFDEQTQPTLFAVGRHGTVLRRLSDGTWLREESGVTADLRAVGFARLGAKATMVAVGQSGTAIVRDDFGSWTKHQLFSTDDLTALNGSPLVIVGAHGTVLAPAGFWLGLPGSPQR